MTSSDVVLTHTRGKQSVQGLHSESLLLVLCSQPVLCHLIPDSLPLCVLAVLQGAWHMVGFS